MYPAPSLPGLPESVLDRVFLSSVHLGRLYRYGTIEKIRNLPGLSNDPIVLLYFLSMILPELSSVFGAKYAKKYCMLSKSLVKVDNVVPEEPLIQTLSVEVDELWSQTTSQLVLQL
jgi:hypothetical protein